MLCGWALAGLPTPSSRPQVYYLGEGEASRQWLQQEHNSKTKLCLSHLKAVAGLVLAQHPTTIPLVWDDMLRDIPDDQLTGALGVYSRELALSSWGTGQSSRGLSLSFWGHLDVSPGEWDVFAETRQVFIGSRELGVGLSRGK